MSKNGHCLSAVTYLTKEEPKWRTGNCRNNVHKIQINSIWLFQNEDIKAHIYTENNYSVVSSAGSTGYKVNRFYLVCWIILGTTPTCYSFFFNFYQRIKESLRSYFRYDIIAALLVGNNSNVYVNTVKFVELCSVNFVEYRMLLLCLQWGVLWFQVPDDWQVLKLDPSNLYPELHVKEAVVPTGYSLFIDAGL